MNVVGCTVVLKNSRTCSECGRDESVEGRSVGAEQRTEMLVAGNVTQKERETMTRKGTVERYFSQVIFLMRFYTQSNVHAHCMAQDEPPNVSV